MKRVGICMLAAVFVFGFALSAQACDKEKSGCGKTAALAAAKVTTETAKSGGCSKGAKADEATVARAMKLLPQMTYKVGDLETPCCYTAKKASEESGSAILYMVGDNGYTCRKTAQDKLAEKMKAEMPKLAHVVSSVDGEQIDCFIKAAALASEKEVQVKYLVAGVEFDCPKSAGAVAAKVTEKLKAEGVNCDGSAVTASANCSKSKDACCATAAKVASGSGCSKSAAEASTASASGCGSKASEAKTAAASAGCCSKSRAAVAAVAAAAGCDKAKAEAATASASDSGCSKSKAAVAKKDGGCGTGGNAKEDSVASASEAKTASASVGCCKSKAATATASAGGCDKSKSEAATASASEGGCSKSKAATASKTGCGSSASKATIAEHFAADPAAAEALEDTEELARAKQMVRQIVDFVSTQKES